MTTITGKGVCGGYAFGHIAFYRRAQSTVKRSHIVDTRQELRRFEQARQHALTQLADLYQKAVADVGEANAQIFEIHQMMLEDEDYLDSITNIITTQLVNAEYAVATTGDNFAKMFSSMDDDYMRERAADVKDISERTIRALTGATESAIHTQSPVVLAADDLAPSETVQLDKSRILSFLTQKGSGNSHTAILARMMDIPAIVGLGDALAAEFDGRYAAVDGFAGVVYIDPDEETLQKLRAKAKAETEKVRRLTQLRGKENRTLDGHTIELYANIGSVGDVAHALQNDAGGIGLFRSEFLYLQGDNYPNEEEQFQAYKTVAETMAGHKVIIRTLDIGADKQIGYFGLEPEENPAMGFRAIRICLERQDIFRTQLRALYRASVFGTIAIMFPMITAVSEVREIKALVEQVQQELKKQGVPFSANVEIGIMIETPAAAVISDLLAPEVDFFSIGTNDLTQYLLAVDRQNQKLERYYNPHHPALLRCLKMVADNAHRAGKWVGICGELAGDTSLTETFLAIGIDELSVSPNRILLVREKIRSIRLDDNKEKVLSTF